MRHPILVCIDFCTREISVFLGPTFLFDSLPKMSLHFTSDAEAGLRRYNHPGPWPMPHTLIPPVFFTTKVKVYYVTSYLYYRVCPLFFLFISLLAAFLLFSSIMHLSILSSAIVLLATNAGTVAGTRSHTNQSLVSDINFISQQWGQISTYSDNLANAFGVKDVGLPAGCQVEQAHTLQRHAQRFPTSYVDDGILTEEFAQKVVDYRANSSCSFSGPLSFLNSYKYQMNESFLTSIGANTEFSLGVQFWNRYGRTLYNASAGQVSYDTEYANGTARPKPVLRTTSQSRIRESQINWALGFFGPTYEKVPMPKLTNYTSGDFFDLVVIPEGGTENNTLASYDSCFNDFIVGIGDLGDQDVFTYIPRYLQNATARLQQYVPAEFTLSTNNTYAMQLLCAYGE
jgi:hypothetical protein